MIEDGPIEQPQSFVKKSLNDYPSNSSSPYPGFSYAPGVKKQEPPEFKIKDLGQAVYETSTFGLAHRITEDILRPDDPTPGYDYLEHVDDEFLNENDIWYFVNDVNASQTIANNKKLRREKSAAEGINNYPWRYAGAYIAESLVDPVNWLFPGSKIAIASKEALDLVKASRIAMAAKALTSVGAQSALLGAGAGAVQETLMQQTQITREMSDSIYGVLANAALSGVLGVAIPAAISGYHYGKATSQLANVMAGNTPTPTVAPKSPVYAMDIGMKAEMKGDDVLAALPEFTRKTLNISPAGRLRNSESVSANLASTDMATTSLVINKNLLKNQPTQISLDEHIASLKNQARKTSIDVNAIFMEQQGVSGAFKGIKSRIAEGRDKGLNRIDFSTQMFESMESGIESAYPHVNKAVSRVKDYLKGVKEELVSLGKLDKKFLEPEFDNYFTHHWLESVISRNHEQFKLIMYKWYTEVNDFYKNNQAVLRPIADRVERTQGELDKAYRNIQRVLNSKEYKNFQANKKSARETRKAQREGYNQSIKELSAEIRETGKKVTQAKKLPSTNELSQQIMDLENQITRLSGEKESVKTLVKDLSLLGKSEKSKRFDRQVQLEERISRYKQIVEEAKEKLYSKIPAKYLVPGGWVPLGNKNPLELHAAAMQTFYRTTGSDVANFINPLIGGGSGKPDPLQARLLTIPYNYQVTDFQGNTITASDFLSKDIFRMLDNYGKATATTIGFERLARSRGFKEVSELKQWYMKNIEADYDEMLAGKKGNEALKFVDNKKKDLKDLNNLFGQMDGTAGGSFDIFGKTGARFVRRLREYNSERLLGSAALSSLTDPFVAPFRHGIFEYTREWLIPFAKQISGPNKAFKINKEDIKDAGFAIETEWGTIAKKFYDNDDLLIEQKWWHNVAEPATTMFGNITGLSQINDFVQSTAGLISISRTLRNIDNKITTGKLNEKNRIRLRQIGISEESERHIYDMWKEKGFTDRGAYGSNHNAWNITSEARAKAYQEFIGAFQRDITHSTLRSSKSEQPAFYDSMLGKLLFHFKDYLLASTQKLFLTGLQKIGMREYSVVLSSIVGLASGVMTYALTSLAKDPTGKNFDANPERLLREGLDRSALLGLFMEPINMFQKQGWLPGQTVSRYQSRGLLGNWAGPEIGVAQDLADALVSPVVRKVKGEGVYSTNDALKILRLLPFHNLFYLRYLNEQITKKTAESLGATRKD